MFNENPDETTFSHLQKYIAFSNKKRCIIHRLINELGYQKDFSSWR
jgi:hypothetical protein